MLDIFTKSVQYSKRDAMSITILQHFYNKSQVGSCYHSSYSKLYIWCRVFSSINTLP